MTDNEIIKALECCNSPYSDYRCVSCPLYDTEGNCKTALTVVALSLINRQKAEIDKLKIENCALSEKRITFPERLKIVKHARNHAIKEFAEMLKERYIYVTPNEIDNLVKEITKSEE